MSRSAFVRLLTLPLLALLVGSAALAEELLLDGVAAQVGGEVVLISEVQELARPVEERMREAGASDADVRNMHAEALERLIETKLIKSVVTRFELEATDGEVDSALMGIARDTGLTVEQLQRSAESHGLTVDEYRGKLKEEIERSKVVNAMVRSQVRVDVGEVRRLYDDRYGEQPEGGEEVHVRHILVAIGGNSMRSPDTACSIAVDARRKLVAGEIAFPDLARRVTDMNPEAAGDLGWLMVDDLAPWMSEPLSRMEPGDVSDVIRTGFGCNLLELVERRSYERITFEQAEEMLTAELTEQKMEREYLDWLETLRKQIYVSRKGLYAEGRRHQPGSGSTARP